MSSRFCKLLDALLQQPAVGFELGFARAAQADRTAALALQVGPAAHQARGHVLQLREFDLQLAFVAARALREDVEDQPGAVDHAALEQLLEVAFLAGRQRMVDQDQVGAAGIGRGLHFLELAAADQGRRIGLVDARGEQRGDGRAGGTRQVGELLQRALVRRTAGVGLDQQGVLALAGSFEQVVDIVRPRSDHETTIWRRRCAEASSAGLFGLVAAPSSSPSSPPSPGCT